MLDLFNREIVGWSIKLRMTADIGTDALTMAWFRRKPDAGIMFHSDRGSQYVGHAMTTKLTEYGMTASMSRKGNCWDNAPTESFFKALKQNLKIKTFVGTSANAVRTQIWTALISMLLLRATCSCARASVGACPTWWRCCA